MVTLQWPFCDSWRNLILISLIILLRMYLVPVQRLLPRLFVYQLQGHYGPDVAWIGSYFCSNLYIDDVVWYSIQISFREQCIRFSTSGHSLIWFRWGAVSTWFCGSLDTALWRWESISGHLFALNKRDDLIFQGRWCQFSSICLLSQVFHA